MVNATAYRSITETRISTADRNVCLAPIAIRVRRAYKENVLTRASAHADKTLSAK